MCVCVREREREMITILLLLLLCKIQSVQSFSCDDDSDCTYNGKCDNGKCRCEDAFRGERCDMFNFVPRTYVNEGLRTLEDNGTYTSSWGGSVLYVNVRTIKYYEKLTLSNTGWMMMECIICGQAK